MADGAVVLRGEKYSRLPCSAQNCGTPALIESPVLGLLRKVHAELLTVREGRVAGYIPKLEQVAPDQFGIALVTADGHLYEVGDTRSPFTIQSISKPLIYGLALQDHGRDHVLARIGVEPSGDPFNAISFDDRKNRPFNAMVNPARSRRHPWYGEKTLRQGWRGSSL